MSNDRSVFLAGASGAIGKRLCLMLVADGWQVTGTTRRPEQAQWLRSVGVLPALVDVYDETALHTAVAQARPRVVIHQLTDLPPALDPSKMDQARIANARIRDVGTRHLVAASLACGAQRMIAQSIAFAYAAGPAPHPEDAPLASQALADFEKQVLGSSMTGIVLRYGKLYGPGTGFEHAADGGPVHVDAAAAAARLAISCGTTGVYNIAEDDGTVSIRKAVDELGWNPGIRLG